MVSWGRGLEMLAMEKVCKSPLGGLTFLDCLGVGKL